MANANAWNNDTVDYLQQCKEEIRVLFEQDGYEIDMLNVLENMLVNLPVASKAARGQKDPRDCLEKVGNTFIAVVQEITTYGADPEDDVVVIQNSSQALYVKNISILEACSIKEKWAAVGLSKLKGEVTEAHSRAYSILKHTNKEKMTAATRSKIVRREIAFMS